MAKGLKCRCCGHPMYAAKEQVEPKGTWVWYECRNGKCTCTEKVFEPK